MILRWFQHLFSTRGSLEVFSPALKGLETFKTLGPSWTLLMHIAYVHLRRLQALPCRSNML